MGSGNSHLQQQQPMIDHQGLPAIMGGHDPASALISYQQQQQQPQYPDMNQIFKGIPKMMQVADDMHRMTNYMQDLRNLMYFCTAFCALGILLFLLLRFMQNRKSTQRRRRPHNNPRTDDSEQSSLSISRPNNFRHYQSARPVDNWTHKIEMDRMIDSTSTRHTNMTHHGTQGGGSGSVHGPGHGLMLNSKAALLNSPEHQHHQQQQQHHPHYNNASPDPQSSTCLQQQPPPQIGRSQTATPTPTPSAGPQQQPPFLHHPTAQHHHHPTQPQQANGQLKRLDPVKLVVDEMPYVDHNEQDDDEH